MTAVNTLARHVAIAVSCLSLLVSQPAWACLSCGCGGSSASTDLGAIGGASSIFAMGHKFLFQQGLSLRTVTGSFNELGTWTPTPTGGLLATAQGAFGLRFFPTQDASIGLTLPVVGNALDRAAWGPYGSVSPTDVPLAMGGALGDVSLQGSYKLLESGPLALGAWGGMILPSGNALGDAASLTGSGIWSGQLGLTGISQCSSWEVIANVGTQLPIASVNGQGGVFALGPAAIYQLQVDYLPADGWRVGLGLTGYLGQAFAGSGGRTQLAAKMKLLPSVAYQWSWTQGVRAALGIDPMVLGSNSMTDATLYVVLFQFL